ncbi:hypothetical protein VZ95_11105 [Elstera litoralis]|uniref:DUF2948 domain-containing protein n=1 Tax=Elstera litoralis TaxID=552518 RepID=A0A0F3IV62_9PROT|nr:DUF2948 family protein [Elstera litoralis]KJV09499.1 hypothetical protein VZ95_11105 [Elstera litoralis]
MSAPGLKLKAVDSADLEILSACLQDALLPVLDLYYDGAAQEFLLVANRFRWEAPAAQERTHMAVRVRGVTGVQRKGFDLKDQGRFLALLALTYTPTETGGLLHLHCAGDSETGLRLSVKSLDLLAQDFGEPWPSASVPTHGDSGKGAV